MKINEIIRIEREKQKISRKKIAEKLFISDGTYRDIETGKIRLSLDNFITICKELNISPMELLKENNDEHYILINEKDINELNKIINKINNQIIKINNKNENSINISGNVNNSFNNSFNNKK